MVPYVCILGSDMVERRIEVVGRLKVLEESAAPLISFLQNPALVQELRSDKHYNLQMLQDRYQVIFLRLPLPPPPFLLSLFLALGPVIWHRTTHIAVILRAFTPRCPFVVERV